MLLTTPSHHGIDTAVLGESIEALSVASVTSAACADACLDEYDLRRDCVAACHTVADIAGTTARVLARSARWDAPVVHGLVEVTARALSSCAAHCEDHATTAKHCQVCADDCRRAEKACQQLLAALATLAANSHSAEQQ
jgi:hypothetical protein